MKTQPRDVLRRFVQRTNELEKLEFIDCLKKQGGAFKLFTHYKDDGSMEIENVGPDDAGTLAFLTKFRPFVLQKDYISIDKLEKLLNDPNLSPKWKRETQRLRIAYFHYINEPDKTFSTHDFRTRRDIMDMFIKGWIFHVNDGPETQLYEKWKTQDHEFAHLVIAFNSILYTVYNIIVRISTLSTEELGN